MPGLSLLVFAGPSCKPQQLLSAFSVQDVTGPRRTRPRKRKGLKKMKKTLASLGLCLLFSCTALAASTKEELQDRVDAAKTVLDQVMAAGDHSIPMNILQQAT